jgi:glycosyltransferase involved in cell wall biosynthesis
VSASVIIPTRGRPEILAETLASVAALDPPPLEVLVVDGDPAGSARAVVAAHPGIEHVPSPPGLTVQRNVGLDRARGDVVVFLDDDVTVSRRLLAPLLAAYDDAAVVGATGTIVEENRRRIGGKQSGLRRLLLGRNEGRMTSFGYPRRLLDPARPADLEFMQGAFMSARTAVAREVRFDEALTGYALAEDEDFSYRLSRRGRVRHVPDAVLHHRNLGFRSAHSREFNRAVVVNRAYLFHKNFSPTPAARAQFAVFVGVLVAHRALNREWDGVRGLLEGAREARRATQPPPPPPSRSA